MTRSGRWPPAILQGDSPALLVVASAHHSGLLAKVLLPHHALVGAHARLPASQVGRLWCRGSLIAGKPDGLGCMAALLEHTRGL